MKLLTVSETELNCDIDETQESDIEVETTVLTVYVSSQNEIENCVVNSSTTNQKKKGPYSMEKEEENFQQLRKLKLKKLGFGLEICKICDKKFTSITLANKHARRNSCFLVKSKKVRRKKKVDCEACNLRFETRQKYINHFEKLHAKKVFDCPDPDCNKKFKRRRLWRRHMDEKHAADGVWHSCEHCNFKSRHKCNLKAHIKTKHRQEESQDMPQVPEDIISDLVQQPLINAPVESRALRERPVTYFGSTMVK